MEDTKIYLDFANSITDAIKNALESCEKHNVKDFQPGILQSTLAWQFCMISLCKYENGHMSFEEVKLELEKKFYSTFDTYIKQIEKGL